MTLVVGATNKKCVVIAADGIATDKEDGGVVYVDFNKIFGIGKGIYFGIAASDISLKDIMELAYYAHKEVDLSPPFKLSRVAESFAKYAKQILEAKSDEFEADFILGGFDRNKLDKPTKPHIFRFSSDTGYKVIAIKGKQIAYAPDMVDVAKGKKLPEEPIDLANLTARVISFVSKQIPGIGGKINMVIIDVNGSQGYSTKIDEQKTIGHRVDDSY